MNWYSAKRIQNTFVPVTKDLRHSATQILLTVPHPPTGIFSLSSVAHPFNVSVNGGHTPNPSYHLTTVVSYAHRDGTGRTSCVMSFSYFWKEFWKSNSRKP